GSPPVGLIVATGNVGTPLGVRVFATLDPTDGHQLRRYTMTAAAVAYDEQTDLWYIFESGNVPPIPTQPMTLHVGRIDAKTGIYTELHTLDGIPVLRDANTVAVLNHRLVYRAYDPTSDAGFMAPLGLAVIDTTNPQPAIASFGGFLSVQTFFGFIPLRATGIDGGTLNLVIQETCTTSCPVDRLQVTFPSDPSVSPGVSSTKWLSATIPLPPNEGSIAAAWAPRVKGSPEDLLIWPPDAMGTDATIRAFNPNSQLQNGSDITFSAPGSNQFFAAVVDECDDVLVASEQQNKALWAVSLTNPGQATSASTSDPAQVLGFEPVTKTVLVPLHLQGVPLLGYALTVDGSGNPTLAPRSTGWSPPSDLVVDAVTVKRLTDYSASTCGAL
ncbi:MAG TPA: hypothetical protein VHB21_28090, partial [Minicystis sp.]|nr:hypothetical protein [Minicystis sp.]